MPPSFLLILTFDTLVSEIDSCFYFSYHNQRSSVQYCKLRAGQLPTYNSTVIAPPRLLTPTVTP